MVPVRCSTSSSAPIAAPDLATAASNCARRRAKRETDAPAPDGGAARAFVRSRYGADGFAALPDREDEHEVPVVPVPRFEIATAGGRRARDGRHERRFFRETLKALPGFHFCGGWGLPRGSLTRARDRVAGALEQEESGAVAEMRGRNWRGGTVDGPWCASPLG